MDEPFRVGTTGPNELFQLLKLPEQEQELLRKTEEDFYNESLEVGGRATQRRLCGAYCAE